MSLTGIQEKAKLRPIRLVIHGGAGIGKTTYASKMNKPIAILTEDGLGNLEMPHFPQCKSWEEVKERLLQLLKEDHDKKTLVIDSLDWLQNLIWDFTCKENGWASMEAVAYGKSYKEALKYWREFIELTNELRMSKGMVICMICHSEIRSFNDPESESYDKYFLKLQKGASALIEENADAIFFMAFKKGTVKSQGKGGENIRVVTGDRTVYAEETASFIAKNRYQLPKELPFDWSEVRELIIKSSKANSGNENAKES